MRSTLHHPRRHGSGEGPGSGRRSRHGHGQPVQSITGAPLSARVDQNRRLRNYLISMTIRTVCFILAGIFAITTSWTWLAWICIAAAAVLPYPAVVFANAVDRRRATTEVTAPYLMLGPGSDAAPGLQSASSDAAPHDPPQSPESNEPPESHEPPNDPGAGRWYVG